MTLPASGVPGNRSVPLEVLDAGGAVVGRHWICWEVAAALIASPSGLFFADDAQAADGLKVVVRSRDGQPFRIISATTDVGGFVVQVDDEARPVHVLAARLGGRGGPESRAGEIIVRTDHSGQPILKVAIYIAGREPGAVPHDAPRQSQ